MNFSNMKLKSKNRMRLELQGAVQGVGFRPFVYQLATRLGLTGWVRNTSRGVVIEVEGQRTTLDDFLDRLDPEKPPAAQILDIDRVPIRSVNDARFEILSSEPEQDPTVWILPDLATCAECRMEITDHNNRRYQYPFTNCTRCGPRYSILKSLPYDRPRTSMSGFAMCDLCQAEYENPEDRRFHAQPNACRQCGPHMEFWTPDGRPLFSHAQALNAAVAALRNKKIIAVKGLGGFHLMVDARDRASVNRLRETKHRSEKPFATLFPSLEMIQAVCEVSTLEEELLCSLQAPIVLLKKKSSAAALADNLAPRNRYLGVMLPYTPLHHILMQELDFPVVATSGNISEETLCIDNHEAVDRLGSMTDGLLVHNRDIVHPADDSVVRVMMGRPMILRRARAYAPLPLPLPPAASGDLERDPVILAVGGHMKNTIAVSNGRHMVPSPHIGDLESVQSFDTFKNTIEQFKQLYPARPSTLACDAHPDYASTRYAGAAGIPKVHIQHHYAHVLSCMADNQLRSPVLGIAWDGIGYGADGSLWGGEFLFVNDESFRRVGSLRPFPLPGSSQAIREPRRSALGLLYEVFGEAACERTEWAPVRAFSSQERKVLNRMLRQHINSPMTSSMGRLFDAVASLLDVRQTITYEGQAAMELEPEVLEPELLTSPETRYPFNILQQEAAGILDWEPMLKALLEDLKQNVPPGTVSVKFHNTAVEMIVAMAHQVGEPQIALTGGCFQNRYLTERAVYRLRAEGFEPYWHHQIPPNDGGIAAGQIVGARRTLRRKAE
jgi:hydrogenase maturation protein HypF